jgi:hypothetical protein
MSNTSPLWEEIGRLTRLRKQYSIWQKILRRSQSHLTPEEVLNARDRMHITQVVLVIGAILLNVAIIFGISLLN